MIQNVNNRWKVFEDSPKIVFLFNSNCPFVHFCLMNEIFDWKKAS